MNITQDPTGQCEGDEQVHITLYDVTIPARKQWTEGNSKQGKWLSGSK